VKASTVGKCFANCGFEQTSDKQEDEFDEEDNIPLARLVHELQKHMSDPLTAGEYEEIDQDTHVMNNISPVDDLLNADARPIETDSEDEEEEEDDTSSESVSCSVTAIPQALKLLDQTKDFCAHSNNADMLAYVATMQD